MKDITLISGVMASGKSKMVFDLVDQFKDEKTSYKLFIPECQTHIKSRAKKEILEAEQVHSAEQVINTNADKIVIDECFDGDTEILTDKGFKKFKELDHTELVAQYENGKVEFVKPIRYIKRWHNDKMINLKTHRNANIIMTPNHNQYYIGINNKEFLKPIKDISMIYANKIVVSQMKDNSQDKLTAFERLLIATQADSGTFKENNFSTYGIALKRERKINNFIDIINNSDIVFREVKAKPNEKRWLYNLYDYPNKKAKYLHKCFDLKDFSYSKARDFIEEVCKWDGSCDRDTGKPRCYDSTVKENVDFVSAVAFLGGYQTYQIKKVDNRKDTYSDLYRVFFLDNNLKNTQSFKKDYIDYNDYVYCVEVPSHKIVVRNGGFSFVSGNCQFLPLYQLKKIVESDNKATLILVGLQKDLFNHEFKNYKYLKTVERIEHIRLHAECDFCKKAMADFSCCEKMGKGGSLLTDDGAVYKNTCVKCATERDII